MTLRLPVLALLGTAALATLSACGSGDSSAATVVVVDASPSSVVTTSSGTAGGVSKTDTPTPAPSPDAATPTPSRNGEDTSQVMPCGDILVLLDKQHRLASDCAPADLEAIPAQYSANGTQYLRGSAANALLEMFLAAAKDGHQLYGISGYRSYDTQVVVFNNEVAAFGREQAERQSARPGHSEHQLGTTMDITSPAVGNGLSEGFGDTPEGKWLAANSWRYGFVMSYPAGKEAVTGYIYEPWHFRYIGKDAAAAFRATGKTLREYLLR